MVGFAAEIDGVRCWYVHEIVVDDFGISRGW